MCFSNLSYQRSTDVSIGNAKGKTERTQTGVKTSVIIAEGKNIHHSLQPFRLLSENQSSLLMAAIPLYTEPPAEPIKEAHQRPDSTPVFGVLFTCAEIEKRSTETRSRRKYFCVQLGFGACTNKYRLAKWIARRIACWYTVIDEIKNISSRMVYGCAGSENIVT